MTEKIRFVVLTNGRSGSNFLVNALNQHPAVLNYGEALGDWTTPWKLRRWLGARTDAPAALAHYLDGFFCSRLRFYGGQAIAARDRLRRAQPVKTKRWGVVRAVGFKEFQLNFDRRGLAGYLRDRPEIRVIGLVRRDPVRRYLSAAMLRRTGQAAARDGERAAFEKLTIDPAAFVQGVTAVADENRRLDQALREIDEGRKLLVDYDDYFGDAGAMRDINRLLFEFLSLVPVDVASEHRKLNTRSLRDTLANYSQICDAARNAGLENFLSETGAPHSSEGAS